MLVLLLSAAVMQAGVAITSVVNGSSAPVLDSSFGTMDLAFNLGQTGGGTFVRDGITYTHNGVTGTTPVVCGTVSGITATAGAYSCPFGTLVADPGRNIRVCGDRESRGHRNQHGQRRADLGDPQLSRGRFRVLQLRRTELSGLASPRCLGDDPFHLHAGNPGDFKRHHDGE